MKEGRIDKSSEPFSVRLKQFWDITQAGSLLSDKFSKMLSHEPDGLIFQPSIDVSILSLGEMKVTYCDNLIPGMASVCHWCVESGKFMYPNTLGHVPTSNLQLHGLQTK
jgi:hypothetical protein